MTIWRMGIARWVHKSRNTFSEYVIVIAFPLQQWLHERASMSRCTYIAVLLIPDFGISNVVLPGSVGDVG
jgi:hypothetical protein